MIPLRDNIPSRTFPFVNYSLIATCVVVFLAQIAGSTSAQSEMIEQYGMIPQRVLNPGEQVLVEERVPVQTPRGLAVVERKRPAAETPFNPWLTLLTSMFLHGGWLHLIGNLWFLHIFGDNVEDRLGHFPYLLFYLGCGLAAALCHLLFNHNSTLPTVGASGAIAGVMGAYLLLYPRAMVLSIVPIFVLIQIIVIPAPVFLVLWFLLQFFQGTMSIGAVEAGGVAWWAHIGGFAAGFAVAALLQMSGATRPKVEQVLPDSDHIGMHPYRRRYS